MNKHTPGPWSIGKPTEYINQIKIEPTIGLVYGAGEEVKANAALVAAAPDMLKALNNVIDMWRNGIPMYKGQAEYHEAIAAVRKARGES